MSEDALASYIDARSAVGNAAPDPADEETRALVGTVRLAEAALGAPSPSPEAERKSRDLLVAQLKEGTPARRIDEAGIVNKIRRWLSGGR
ncbi:MAG: hypothetical protein ACLQVD_10290 [Capsulimonadaceae bacterium]